MEYGDNARHRLTRIHGNDNKSDIERQSVTELTKGASERLERRWKLHFYEQKARRSSSHGTVFDESEKVNG